MKRATRLRRAVSCAAFVALALAFSSCDTGEPVGEGEVCRFCAGGRRSGQCSNSTTASCAAGLECLTETSTCERRLTAGEPCDHRACAEGLACDVDDVCNPPAAAGARCGVDEDCAGGGACLHGGAGVAAEGVCGSLDGGLGAPCEWAPDYGSGSCSFGRFGTRGCGAGAVCQAGPRSTLGPDGSVLEPVEGCNRLGFTGCGYPGTCVAAGAGARGEPCVDDGGCASGVCGALPPPRTMLDDLPGYDCKGCQECFRGLWPGLCMGDSDLGPRGDCFELQVDPDAARCGPGLACLGRKCWPLYDVLRGAKCETHGWTEAEGPPPVCYAGDECVDDVCAPATP